jgi:tRNA (guanine37-N1)-methyltransferase
VRIGVVTLFPELFEPVLACGMVGRARDVGAIDVRLVSPREFGHGKHRAVDDTPYGGGAGMVMRVDCIVAALEALDDVPHHRVLLSPQGEPLTQLKVLELAQRPAIALVCGRYEGVDERVHEHVAEALSLGDYVLSGGEIAALAVIDACARLQPGVLGNPASLDLESHSPTTGGLLEYPQYTRPIEFRGSRVPDILQSGHHARIAEWRHEQALARSASRRPDIVRRLGGS